MKRHLAPNLHVPLALNMRHSWGLVAALACCWTCGGLEPGVFWLLTQFGLCLPWRRGRLTRDSSILAGIWPNGRLGGFYKCNQNPLWRPIRSYWRIRISEWCTPGSIPPGPVKAPPSGSGAPLRGSYWPPHSAIEMPAYGCSSSSRKTMLLSPRPSTRPRRWERRRFLVFFG